jgi:hypothetical protein
MTTPSDDKRFVTREELLADEEAFIKLLRKDIEEKLAPMSREERRRWLKKFWTRLLGDLAAFEPDLQSEDEEHQG